MNIKINFFITLLLLFIVTSENCFAVYRHRIDFPELTKDSSKSSLNTTIAYEVNSDIGSINFLAHYQKGKLKGVEISDAQIQSKIPKRREQNHFNVKHVLKDTNGAELQVLLKYTVNQRVNVKGYYVSLVELLPVVDFEEGILAI